MPASGSQPGARASSWRWNRLSSNLSGNDIEDPLMEDPGSPAGSGFSNEAPQTQPQAVPHIPKPWPTLRMSSISTRRPFPQYPDLDGNQQPSSPYGTSFRSAASWMGVSHSLGSSPSRSPPWIPGETPASPRLRMPSTFVPAMGAPPPPKPREPSMAELVEPQSQHRPSPFAQRTVAEGQEVAQAYAEPSVEPSTSRHRDAAVIGLLDVMLALPVMASFAAIIFQDKFFAPYIGDLVKMVCLSSALHQVVFTLSSTLPFAMGQVQDVGLIFLSAIATHVATAGRHAGVSDEETLATVLVTLTLSTTIVGLLIITTGAVRLASLVQYVPLPVIGGYLAFVGLFCVTAGLSLAAGVHVDAGDPFTWTAIVGYDPLIRLAPALLLVMLITIVQKRYSNPLALPALLAACPLVFLAIVYALGYTLDDARNAGWVTKPIPGEGAWKFWEAWKMFGFHEFPPKNIHWRFVPRQAGKILALYFVVAFGSSMDIAAIQADVDTQLDYNRELITVGLSNLVTGVVGVGYTGSYIFSQTLFNLKMGVNSPVMGIVVATGELLLFMLPINAMTYLPNLLFGAMVMWIGQDILKDWLFIAYKRISKVEYALLVATFVAILVWGLEIGIAAGIVAATLHFTYSYSRVTLRTFTVVPSRSGSVSARVLQVAQELVEEQQRGLGDAEKRKLLLFDGVKDLDDGTPATTNKSGRQEEGDARLQAALQAAPLFLILDFRRVQGMDATTARTFTGLHTRLQRLGVQLIITHLPEEVPLIRTLLVSQGLILYRPTKRPEDEMDTAVMPSLEVCQWFETMEMGLHFCEENFLDVAIEHKLTSPRRKSVTLVEALEAHMPGTVSTASPDACARAAMALEQHVKLRNLSAGEVLFEVGDDPHAFFIVKTGSVIVEMWFGDEQGEATAPTSKRLFYYEPGGVVGDTEYFLDRQRTFRARATTASSVWELTREGLAALVQDSPETTVLVQSIVLRSACLSVTHAFEVLDRLG